MTFTYVPPHLRNSTRHSTQFNTRPDSSRYQSGQRNPCKYRPRNDPLEITEKFEEMEVTGDNNVGKGINFNAYDNIPVETSGSDVPEPINTFEDVDLGEGLNANIRRCNYVKPTPVQRYAIPISLMGRDLMACAQTGSGKTAAFCFPIISRIMKNELLEKTFFKNHISVAYPSALILAPTRELVIQIHEEARKFASRTCVKICVAYGGASIVQQLRSIERGVDILVATPGRLVDMIERSKISLKMIKHLALDEGDRMLDMGFEPQIRKIVEHLDMPPPGTRQTMLFSATFPDEIQKLASDFLSNYIFLAVGRVGSSTELISQRVNYVPEMHKKNHLIDILCDKRAHGSHGKHALTLVFVETKRSADALEHWLCMNGFPATAIHGDKVQMERERALRSFKSGHTPIMVATDVASRGLDVPHVAHVINFDMPKDIDDYVHRIGRTGRAGKSGLATAFFSDKNQNLARSLVELMLEANQQVPDWLSQYSERTSYGNGGRSNHYGGGRFGGRDFRNRSKSTVENDYYMNPYSAGQTQSTVKNDYHSNPYGGAVQQGDYYVGENVDYSYGHGIASSGWE